VYALTVYNGELIAAGYFTTAGGVSANYIARWDGSQWRPLGSGIGGTRPGPVVCALTVYNGDLIAGGDFTNAGGASANSIAKWNGTSWSPLGSGANAAVQALAVYNGELIATQEIESLRLLAIYFFELFQKHFYIA
jgi:peptidoglycan hydrolase-like amidase